MHQQHRRFYDALSARDANATAWAGAPYEVNDPIQPMSLHFRVIDVHAPADMALRDRCTALFQQAQADTGIPCVAAHDTYLINPCSEDAEILGKSRDALADELVRSTRLGGRPARASSITATSAS